MVNYKLMIKADLENLTNLQPLGGCDDPNFTFFFKLKCERCQEVSQKETSVSLDEVVPIPGSKGHANLVQKCKFCGREGHVTMVPGRGRPYTQEDSEEGKFVPVMAFDCRGFEPLEYSFVDEWKAESLAGTKYENIDLSEGDWAEYDEKGSCPVSIANLLSRFDVMK